MIFARQINQNVSKSLIPTDDAPQVIGGEEAVPREFRSMAAIGYKKENETISWNCGGCLVLHIAYIQKTGGYTKLSLNLTKCTECQRNDTF